MGLDQFQGIILTIVIIAILVGAGLLAQVTFRDALTTDSAEYNATNQWVSAQSNISSKAPTFGTLVGVSLVVLGAFFIFGMMKGSKV